MAVWKPKIEITRHTKEIVEMEAEIERLTQLLNRVQADIELWNITGRHRTCMCPACEDLRDIATSVQEVNNGRV